MSDFTYTTDRNAPFNQENVKRFGSILSLDGKAVFTISWRKPCPRGSKEPEIAFLYEDGRFYVDGGDRHIRKALRSLAQPDTFLGSADTLDGAVEIARSLIPHLPR